jgi:class 3 adenylate cyclase/predicted ATPase
MTEREKLEQALTALEAQRPILGDVVVDTALVPLREKLAALIAAETQPPAAPATSQQRKQVTVLFADVSGFTAMSEKMDAEEVSATMNDLWTRLDGAILNQGGRIDKHIGDAVMALFGTPTAREDDPERAIRAALEMQAALSSFLLDENGQPRLRMRIGINTGPVLLGAVGTTGEYTAMGDAVNLASRLEHAAPIGGILISHDSYRHVRGIFDVAAQTPISVKGKTEPIQVYIVRAAKPKAFRVTTRGVEGIETRTIGRERELAQMQNAFETMRAERRSHLVNLVAEAGTGKSRLLYEFSNWLELAPVRTRLFRGRATEGMLQLPYALLRDVLTSRFEISETDRASTVREKVEEGVVALTVDEEDAVQWAHFIGHLAGFDFSTSPHLQGILGDAQQIRDRALFYFTQFVAKIAEERPIVFLLEDIHWADASSLDLMMHLLRTRPDLPVLVVGLTRATLFEHYPAWGDGPMEHVRIDLKALSLDDSRRLVREILRQLPDIPDLLMEMIVGRAEGSPFYIEELIKMFIDDGVIVTSGETWRVELERLAQVRVPATLTGILQARLDSLPNAERETLQQAAVIGRIFWDNVLRQLGTPEPVAAEHLNGLNRKELIFRREESSLTGTDEFIFKNVILHDVTYESVLKRLRRQYHAQVAQALVELAGDRVNEYASRIGEHFERAEDWAHAGEWFGRAGKQAQTTFAPTEALRNFQRALQAWEHGTDTPEIQALKIQVYRGLGDALTVQARSIEAAQAFTTMRDLAGKLNDVVAQSQAWYGLALASGDEGDLRKALSCAEQARTLAEQANADAELVQANWIMGRTYLRLGDGQKALAAGAEVVEHAGVLKQQLLQARGLNLLGGVNYSLGHYGAAEACWEEASQVFQAAGDRVQVMQVLNNLGVLANGRGDSRLAFERYSDALQMAREVGHRDGEATYLGNLAEVRNELGDYVKAEEDLRQAIHFTEAASHWNLSFYYRCLAEACVGQNKLEEALSTGRTALNLGQEAGDQELIIAAWRVLGVVAARLNQTITVAVQGEEADHTATSLFTESLRIATETEMTGERARTLKAWALYEMQTGQHESGTDKWQEARELFASLGATQEAERMASLPTSTG